LFSIAPAIAARRAGTLPEFWFFNLRSVDRCSEQTVSEADLEQRAKKLEERVK
jgi:hypothetical protein